MKISFNDLEDNFDSVPTSEKEQQKYPCGRCHGTGKYLGVSFNSFNPRANCFCFACKGKGYFLTSPEYRQKTKQNREDRKLQKAKKWIKDHREEMDYLLEIYSWNEFAQSIVQTINNKGELTDGQLEAVRRGMEKRKANKAAKQEIEDNKETIDLTRINELLSTAISSGLRKPRLNIGQLSISVAPSHGRNAGCLYIKDNRNYAGKITKDGKFFGIHEARNEIEGELLVIAKDPLEAAIVHGRKTGQCACCGRELTSHESIELGIGPICRNKWGL